jgi:2-dehydropantoate 2-reductase
MLCDKVFLSITKIFSTSMTNFFPWEQHTVFGAGLIGSYLGGALSVQGFQTTLICRAATKSKLTAGLKLTDYQGHEAMLSKIDVLDDKQLSALNPKVKKALFLWLTVKCTGIKQAVIDIAPLVDENTIILCCQNGLGSDAAVKQAYPNNIVLRVMVPFNVVELSPGHYHRGSEGKLTIEQTTLSTAGVGALVMSLNSELLPTSTTADMDALLWAKLQLNLGNSVNALADIPVKAMLEQRDYRKVIALLMGELLQVADALNIALPKVTAISAHKIPMVLRLPNFIFSRVANKMLEIDPKVRSSMWWDVSQGKPTEIEHINGAILQHAKTLGIACPVNEKVSDLIIQLSNKTELTDEQKPPIAAQTLLARVLGK